MILNSLSTYLWNNRKFLKVENTKKKKIKKKKSKKKNLRFYLHDNIARFMLNFSAFHIVVDFRPVCNTHTYIFGMKYCV